ncbi:MAG: hypothetical protein ABI910_03465 [Gemmatimonadota bacterium]
MERNAAAQLGPPQLSLAGFQLWVHGYAYGHADGVDDASWLRLTAHAGAAGASVWVTGVLLQDRDVRRFRDELAESHRLLRGDASLVGYEPGLDLRVADWERSGACRVEVRLTPDPLHQSHRFTFAANQSCIPSVLHACDGILRVLATERYSAAGD